jgi:hypothetical protein
MMLRPTESRIVWLQQFGRGLRRSTGKDRLIVIDYIGNHRAFLTKAQTLLMLPSGDVQLARALDLLEAGQMELPAGCEVTYELEAVNILRALLRPDRGHALQLYYEDFKAQHGHRPTAVEAFHEGHLMRAGIAGHGSWLAFVEAMGGLEARELRVRSNPQAAAFLAELEVTPMTKSYKMLVLLAMIEADRFPGGISIEALARGIEIIAGRSSALQADVEQGLRSARDLRDLLIKNPIAAFVGGKGMGGVSYFSFKEDRFESTIEVAKGERAALQDLTREVVDWRLAAYLSRANGASSRRSGP